MWVYEKKLQYPVRVEKKDLRMANYLLAQYGGPDSELSAAVRYLNQRYTMPTNRARGLLTDIGTEELAHWEIIATLIYKLTLGATSDEMKAAAARGGAAGMSLEALEAFAKQFPPEAIGPFVTWLCTDEAKNINGRTFLVAGRQISLYSEPVWESTIFGESDWTVDRLSAIIPRTIAAGLRNQWPPQEPKE
ncbi:MAG: manganese catalase family protein [Peptococcaceae bacterium]|nr:manganese catalase family protein [Peptococcaceae bacterium]